MASSSGPTGCRLDKSAGCPDCPGSAGSAGGGGGGGMAKPWRFRKQPIGRNHFLDLDQRLWLSLKRTLVLPHVFICRTCGNDIGWPAVKEIAAIKSTMATFISKLCESRKEAHEDIQALIFLTISGIVLDMK
jgi:hypothetical protein